MQVASLFARLSLQPDRRSFSAGDALLKRTRQALIGIASFRTFNFFKRMVTDTTQSAARFADLSKRVGVSVESLQQLGHAADMGGAPLDRLIRGFENLGKNALAAKKGGEDQQKAFSKLGVSYRDIVKGTIPLDDALMRIADRFQAMPDGAQKTGLAMKVFGMRSGPQLIPFLNEGSAGIAKLRKEFVDLGGQIDGKTIAQFEEFDDTQNRMKVALSGLRNEFATALLPHLQRGATSVLNWVKANRQLLSQKVESFVRGIVGAGRVLFSVMSTVVNVVGKVTGVFGGAERTVKLLVSAFLAFKTLGMIQFFAGMILKLRGVAVAADGAAASIGALGAAQAAGGIGGAAGAVAAGQAGKTVGLLGGMGRTLGGVLRVSTRFLGFPGLIVAGLTPLFMKLLSGLSEPERTPEEKREERASASGFLQAPAFMSAAAAQGIVPTEDEVKQFLQAGRLGAVSSVKLQRPDKGEVRIDVGGITINAPGADKAEIIKLTAEEIDQRLRQAGEAIE